MRLTAVAAAVLLVSCGGGGDSIDRGALLETPQTLATLTAAQIDAGTAQSGLQALTGKAQCDVRVVSLQLLDRRRQREDTNASGVMLVPAGACANARRRWWPTRKGTDVQKPRTLANPTDGETFLLAAMYAAQGYAVVATDYLGLRQVELQLPPLSALRIPKPASMIDSIRAARNAASRRGRAAVGQGDAHRLFARRPSSMAAQRAIERDEPAEINVVARGPPGRALQPVGVLQADQCDRRLPVLRAVPGDVLAEGLRQRLQQCDAGVQGCRIRTTSKPCCPARR